MVSVVMRLRSNKVPRNCTVQWWNVTKFIYSGTTQLGYNSEILVL